MKSALITTCYGLFAITYVTVVGCRESAVGEGMTKVRGRVTLDGQELTLGTVTFFHEAGSAATADIQADGSYEAEVKPGLSRIAVVARLPDIENPEGRPSILPGKSLTPTRYEEPATSGLQLSVVASNADLKMDLSLDSAASKVNPAR